MAIALVTSLQGNSTDGNGFTTGVEDDTGANLIVIGLAILVNSGTISDSKGNAWTPLTQWVGSFSDRWFQYFYCVNPTVGSGHTFSVTGTGNWPSLCVGAFSGVATSPFDVENGGTNYGTSVSTGSVTPSEDNELIIAGFNFDTSSTPTVDSSFSILQTSPVGFGHIGQQMAYQIQTTATARNPTFSWTGTDRAVAAIATFKAAGGFTWLDMTDSALLSLSQSRKYEMVGY